MDPILPISSYEAIKILSDARRLEILRTLMVAPATITHLGQGLNMHPARVRYHVKLLEKAGLVALVHTQKVGNYTEKYYQARAQAFQVQAAILPKDFDQDVIVVSGSHDMALECLAETLSQDKASPRMYTLPVGSLDGLIALRQGLCQMAACHLFDPLEGDYNTSYVRHLFPGQTMHVVTLAHRQQGLLVARGNPLGIRGLGDLQRTDITFVNRQAGSGTRLWLDQQLHNQAIDSKSIRGYSVEAYTHAQVAEAVHSEKADVGLAGLAAARKFGLDFVPLFEERFDLVFSELATPASHLGAAFDLLCSNGFRKKIRGLAGYQTRDSGQEIVVGF